MTRLHPQTVLLPIPRYLLAAVELLVSGSTVHRFLDVGICGCGDLRPKQGQRRQIDTSPLRSSEWRLAGSSTR